MKEYFEQLVRQAYASLVDNETLPAGFDSHLKIENTRTKSHGDYSTSAAMTLAKLAQLMIDAMPASEYFARFEIAGPGFINAFLNSDTQQLIIATILEQADQFGQSQLGVNQRIHIEFVSANPTGPLHVGHGRGAAYGASLVNLLKTAGYDVHSEYYVNDAGRQMDILATSIWLRYLELCGLEFSFPVNAYHGDYVWDIAASLHRQYAEQFLIDLDTLYEQVHPDEGCDNAKGDKERHIDDLIFKAKSYLGSEQYTIVFQQGLTEILNNIHQDLKEFGVEFDHWFSEYTLTANAQVQDAIDALKQGGYLYEKNQAVWFRSSEFGDEKDRVVVRDNGLMTYLASDIAYHRHKVQQGYDQVINIWGADHHGYVARLKASLKALNLDPEKLQTLLVQFAVLYEGGNKIPMSTRSGQFVTLRELRHDVGNDAARFFYVMRKSEQHMDFDLKLAKEQSKKNPVYYIQYAHARVCSVFRKLSSHQLQHDLTLGNQHLELLDLEYEQALIQKLSRYPDVIEKAALGREPHQIAYYLRELANDFHSYYNAKDVIKIVDETSAEKRNARLNLSLAVKQVIKNGLDILGVSAPQTM